jgi:hypothetical protein
MQNQMKKQQIFLGILVLSSLLLTNCKSAETEETNEVAEGWEKVMSVHDEIMPITMKFPPLKEELTAAADATQASELVEKIKGQITEIDNAYNAMYDWMEDATPTGQALEKMKKAAALKRLVDEEAKINQIKTATNEAFENTTKLLNELKK